MGESYDAHGSTPDADATTGCSESSTRSEARKQPRLLTPALSSGEEERESAAVRSVECRLLLAFLSVLALDGTLLQCAQFSQAPELERLKSCRGWTGTSILLQRAIKDLFQFTRRKWNRVCLHAAGHCGFLA